MADQRQCLTNGETIAIEVFLDQSVCCFRELTQYLNGVEDQVKCYFLQEDWEIEQVLDLRHQFLHTGLDGLAVRQLLWQHLYDLQHLIQCINVGFLLLLFD